MQSKKLAGPKPGPSTQKYLDIAEIKEDIVVLKDGTMRAVMIASSINFALKSEDEQRAIIQAYMQFLNSLEFPLQIVMQSRRLNIDGYIARLNEQSKKLDNDLLRAQINDYKTFIQELVSLGDIMTKRFYVVIPYDPLSNKRKGWFSKMKEVFTPVLTVKLKDERFQKQRGELMMRVSQLQSLLHGMSIETTLLDTQGLIELYYTVYNPQTFDTQKMQPEDRIRVEG